MYKRQAAAAADVPAADGLGLRYRRAFHLHHGRRRLLFAPIQSLRQQGKNLIHIAHNPVIAVFENRRVGILVDRHNGRGVLDAL